MIICTSTTDKVQVITGSAVAACVMHASYVDFASGVTTPGRTNVSVSTATTTDLVAAPGASSYRNVKFLSVRNTHASSSNTITIQHTDGTTAVILWSGVLQAGQSVQIDERGITNMLSAGGIVLGPVASGALTNFSTATVSAGYAADTYLAGSSIAVPSQGLRAGSRYRCRFDMTKTAAGIATPIINVRIGTAGAVGDTSRATLTFGAGTAAADTGVFEVELHFRTVGSGTSAVLVATAQLDATATAGLSSTAKAVSAVSSGFDSTVANLFIGVSFNGGTSFSGTNNMVRAELGNVG